MKKLNCLIVIPAQAGIYLITQLYRFLLPSRIAALRRNDTIVIITIFFILLNLTVNLSYAQSPTVASGEPILSKQASPSASVEDKEIKSLKEKIATKVAELRKKNNKAVSGTIETVSKTALKIKSSDGKTYDIKIDETLTKIFQIEGNQKKEVKTTELKKGIYVIISGDINDKTVTANFIYIDETYIVQTGKVSEVDKEDFFIKVLANDGISYTLDVETFTKQQMVNSKTDVIEKVGFSKIKEGDTIHFVIKKTSTPPQEVNRYAAQRFLIIPQEYFMK